MNIVTRDTTKSGDGHKRDCGVRALCRVLNVERQWLEDELSYIVGTTVLSGKDMREYMDWIGWNWKNVSNLDDIPRDALVVTHRGFYAVVDGDGHDVIGAPICGYYYEGPWSKIGKHRQST